jgi:substrate import-associated zinc metallohydrolase lipoprotein
MKKIILNISVLTLVVGILVGCSSKIEDVSPKVEGLGGDILPKQAVDVWLEQTFTKPYNIEVKYRWDPYEVDLAKTLTPPLASKVQPSMEAVKAIWIDPYEAEAGSDFIKRFCPKQYVLVGSLNWNTNGTITLGTAEGGRKVVLYGINDFDKKNVEGPTGIKQMLHTIHHEFGHILQQNIPPTVAFDRITAGTYTSTWFNISDATALSLGYVSSYAMNSPTEDFVEVLAEMLVEGKPAFDARVNTITNATARAAIRQKEAIVVDYLKQAYNIDFKNLQTRTQNAIIAFTK